MKKVLCFILVLCFLPCVSFALDAADLLDMDFSALTFNELQYINSRAQLAMWNSEEWQSVKVPQGFYTVGVDIPAGQWTVKCTEGELTHIYYGFGTLSDRTPDFTQGGEAVFIRNVTFDSYSPTEYMIELREGMFIKIDQAYSPALFVPYTYDLHFEFK